MADSFSEGMFPLSLTRLDGIYMIELVACEIKVVLWPAVISRQTLNVILRGSPYRTLQLIILPVTRNN